MGGTIKPLNVEGSNLNQGEDEAITVYDSSRTHKFLPTGGEVEPVGKLKNAHHMSYSIRPNKAAVERQVISMNPDELRWKPLQDISWSKISFAIANVLPIYIESIIPVHPCIALGGTPS